MPSSAKAFARPLMGAMFLLAMNPCIKITIGHLSVSGLKPLGSVMAVEIPPCGPNTSYDGFLHKKEKIPMCFYFFQR